ncbi:MAG: glycerol-3-phosphate 1-O-acyltransferase PlsY [Alphaproteobacteria bacterium]|nr:glycerol-3-phosphate 1-O-acyltransferase PlsY [Alphaproteobacteria bacterium]
MIDSTLVIAALGGYLLGSIPFGLVLTRMAGLGDIRKIGSGSIGATNVLRTGNKPLAFAVLVLDSGKGAIAVLTTMALVSGLPLAPILAGVFAVLGHNYPVWLKFKGGKGIATTLGTLVALSWPVGLATCATWLAVAAAFRYSSLAGMLSLLSAPFWTMLPILLGPAPLIQTAAAFLAVLACIRHATNIHRLLRGEEPKIGQKK